MRLLEERFLGLVLIAVLSLLSFHCFLTKKEEPFTWLMNFHYTIRTIRKHIYRTHFRGYGAGN